MPILDGLERLNSLRRRVPEGVFGQGGFWAGLSEAQKPLVSARNQQNGVGELASVELRENVRHPRPVGWLRRAAVGGSEPIPRQNRVTPLGDLVAVPERG